MDEKLLPSRVGFYSIGLSAYWEQFPLLRDRLNGYHNFIAENISSHCKLYDFGMVDSVDKARNAGDYFAASSVDIIFCHVATYATSDCILPIHQRCNANVVLLNLQPGAEMDYMRTDTSEWLAYCVGCPVPEFANALTRAGINHHIINGLLGLTYQTENATANEITYNRKEAQNAWRSIYEWIYAASIKRNLASARFGFLGNYYSGMLDMYSDFTILQAKTGVHIEILEMCDLASLLEKVTDEQCDSVRSEVENFFVISEDSPSDPLAKRPTAQQLDWAIKVAAAQKLMAEKYCLNGLAYYYHGNDSYYQDIQSGFIAGHSLLTAHGVPCAGEADIKTALAMKMCDIIGSGGSFCEIIAADFNRNTIILGHDGPFHTAIAAQKPILRGMGIYHGKKGSGVSVEAKVKTGDVTTIGLTQAENGALTMIISEGRATDAPILMNGNTSTHIEFQLSPVEYMDKWFSHSPTHHFALAVGHCSDIFEKAGKLMNIPVVRI